VKTKFKIEKRGTRVYFIAVCAFFFILMYSYSLRAAASSCTGLGFALGRFRGGGAVVAALGSVAMRMIPSRGKEERLRDAVAG
jgi:hypothetical protein